MKSVCYSDTAHDAAPFQGAARELPNLTTTDCIRAMAGDLLNRIVVDFRIAVEKFYCGTFSDLQVLSDASETFEQLLNIPSKLCRFVIRYQHHKFALTFRAYGKKPIHNLAPRLRVRQATVHLGATIP